MIIGIGTDICDIRRIEKLLKKHGKYFIDKTFTAREQAYALKRAGKASTYGKRFAAKEAVAKALAGENTGSLSWLDVEVVNAESGKPDVQLYGGALKCAQSLLPEDCKFKIHLSLSDEYPYATAFAIFELVTTG